MVESTLEEDPKKKLAKQKLRMKKGKWDEEDDEDPDDDREYSSTLIHKY